MKEVALSEEQILNYIEERKTARAQKNWKRPTRSGMNF